MSTAYTSLLGLALPATGELSGTWGDTVNNYITTYLDSCIAGALAVSLTADTSLTKTTNSSLGSSSSQYAILNVTPNASTWALTVPAASKMYVVNNLSGTYTFILKASGQTGVTIATSEKCIVAFNGTDFVKIGSSVPVSTITVPQGGTGITSGTSGGVPYFSGTTTIASSAALAANALVLGGGTGVAPATTTTGTGVVTAIGNAVNNTSGLVTQTATLTASALLLGGGASTGIASTTTGSGVVTALGVTTNAAGGIVVKDANSNISVNQAYQGSTSTVSSATLITLTAASTPVQVITGSTLQNINMPNATTLPNGALFLFNNNSTNSVVVRNQSATNLITYSAGMAGFVILKSNATADGTWDYYSYIPSNVTWGTSTLVASSTAASFSSLSLTTALPVASGGTGVASSTGSGNVVLSTSPTLVTPVLGTPTSGTLSACTVDGTNSVGYLNIPQNAQTGSYTTVLGDAGKHIYHASGAGAATYTIAANASVAYPIGTVISFVNLSSTSISIAITSDTLYLGNLGTTGTRTLAQYGVANALKVTSTAWIITGTALT